MTISQLLLTEFKLRKETEWEQSESESQANEDGHRDNSDVKASSFPRWSAGRQRSALTEKSGTSMMMEGLHRFRAGKVWNTVLSAIRKQHRLGWNAKACLEVMNPVMIFPTVPEWGKCPVGLVQQWDLPDSKPSKHTNPVRAQERPTEGLLCF